MAAGSVLDCALLRKEYAIKRFDGFFYGWVIVGICMLLGFLGTGFYSYSRGVFLPSLAETLAAGSRLQIALGFSWISTRPDSSSCAGFCWSQFHTCCSAAPRHCGSST